MEIFSWRDFNLKDKIIALRIDLNLPYDPKTGNLSENARLQAHINTIKKLQKLKSKIVILAHQGRKGKEDFISLGKHTYLLSKYLEKIKFIKFGKNFDQIRDMKNGEVILLDNTRFYEDETLKKEIEEHRNSELIKKLSPLIDYFVLDAFSVAHRNHASVVGFATLKPCLAGPVFEKELKNLEEFKEKLENSKVCFILGGAKLKEPIKLMENCIEKNCIFLTTGILSLLFLIAKGYRLGYTKDYLEKEGYLEFIEKVRRLLNKFGNKIYLPDDLAIERNEKRVEIFLSELPVDEQILDIGETTINKYREIIKNFDVICVKGPAGIYEKQNFEIGTKKIFESLGKNTLVGGGNTIDALKKLGIDFNKFGYVSLSGGAFVDFLSGKKLPGIMALELSFKKFSN